MLSKKDDLWSAVEKAQKGDDDARESLLADHRNFIKKIVSKYIVTYEDIYSRDEYSIGLMAFNESIDNYKPGFRSFHTFAADVIKKRLIDYYRSQKKHRACSIQLTDAPVLEDGRAADGPSEKIQVKLELESFVQRLSLYGISLHELIRETPKHRDSRLMCMQVARTIVENQELNRRFLKYRTIPLTMLMQKIKLNPKTVGRNRKYIISICLVLQSDLEIMKGYINQLCEGGD